MRVLAFSEIFGTIARTLGRPSLTPARAIECWRQFVDNCEEGYEDSLAEYRNELRIRRFLQAVIDDPEVRQSAEAQWFRTEVSITDARFSALISEGFHVAGGWGWWERRIPRVGGGIFLIDVRDAYGVDVEEI
ncbi:hypothetical protein [Streptomyces sp. NPDC059783]|uniref:hypothetical protein n=1 Tax=Streptomyces sp. NPDC059783 TaxID=3346944 RepID=UPI0036648D40